jgi:acetoacetyl-CoA synthetase
MPFATKGVPLDKQVTGNEQMSAPDGQPFDERAALWAPSAQRLSEEALLRFAREIERRYGIAVESYPALQAWSVRERGAFWNVVWDWCGVIGEKGSLPAESLGTMLEECFFPEARLNYAENLLRMSGASDALVFRCEDKANRRMSWDELRELVSRLQQLLVSEGIGVGDRVAAMMPNMPETVAAMIATASIGAVWTSCSPDFGEQAVIDRFSQTEPTILLVPDGYWYNGKCIPLHEKTSAIAGRLPSLRKMLVVELVGKMGELRSDLANVVTLAEALLPFAAQPLAFTRLPFDHPLSIHYSSGTTGAPKCIVHRAGGVLLQHLKEQQFHSSLRSGDRLFYYSTCGWMMWNWLVSGLASGATLLLYDGSPFAPDGNVLFDYASEEKCTHFGVSAKYIDAIRKAGICPIASHELGSLRTVLSTGSPLSSEGYEYVYRSIKSDVHLASIAGGTDILGCFALGVPTLPVFACELQGVGLGMAVEVFDQNGQSIEDGRGELVCTAAFPSMPLGFWNDNDGSRYRSTYFERFPGIWHHGDFVERTARGGLIFHGRSDATLNPGGVRIGTSEIYNQLEAMPEILESACIGQEYDNDVRVVLFVKLASGVELTEELTNRIRKQIRSGASPRHVPAIIAAVPDIPHTKSGKISELAIRDIVHGRESGNTQSLANPGALEHFRNLPVLAA